MHIVREFANDNRVKFVLKNSKKRQENTLNKSDVKKNERFLFSMKIIL